MIDIFLERKHETEIAVKEYREGFEEQLDRLCHITIKAVTQELERYQFNTAVARLMEFRSAIADYQIL